MNPLHRRRYFLASYHSCFKYQTVCTHLPRKALNRFRVFLTCDDVVTAVEPDEDERGARTDHTFHLELLDWETGGRKAFHQYFQL